MDIKRKEARYILEAQRMRGPITSEDVEEYQESLNNWYTSGLAKTIGGLNEKLKHLNSRHENNKKGV